MRLPPNESGGPQRSNRPVITAPTINPIPNSISTVGLSPNQTYAPVTPKTGIKVSYKPAA